MNKRILTFILLALCCTGALFAQGRKSLFINEVMVGNTDNIIDEYGHHKAWIELFNANFAPLEISSVYLTNDPNNPKMYPVPLGDLRTKMGKRQHVVFYADGEPSLGTFHTSFVLEPGKENWVGIYDADGITLLDEVTIPASLPVNASYSRQQDGSKDWIVCGNSGSGAYVTPGGANEIVDENLRAKAFAERDASGAALTIMAMCIVFSALLLLCVCFYIIGRINRSVSRKRKIEAHGEDARELPRSARPDADSGEVIAAIALALNEHLDAHDRESTILTINKVRRAYSPWSSKIYGLREVPRR